MSRVATRKQQSLKDLLRENAELKNRLVELEETLRAIQQGEVDAVVTTGPRGEQVFTLQGADRPYRLLVEEMQEGAAILAPDGVVLFANHRLGDLLEVPLSQLVGQPFANYVAPGQEEVLQNFLASARKIKGRIKTVLSGVSGGSVPVRVSASPMTVDDLPMLSLVVEDRSGEKEQEEASRLVESFALGISQAETIDAALESMLRQVLHLTGWQFGEAWLPRSDRSVLESASAWYGESPALETIRAASVETWLPPGVGFPGRAWIAKQPIWIKDLEQDKGYFGVASAREAGLHAGAAIPIMAMDQVVAVLIFYMRESRSQDEAFIRLVANAAANVSPGLQRKISEAARIAHEALLVEAQHTAHLGDWTWDILEDRFFWSEEVGRIFGFSEDGRQERGLNFESYLGRLHTDDREPTRAAFQAAIQDRQPFVILHHVVRPAGEVRVIETRGRVVSNRAEVPDRIFGVSMDVTEGKRAEEDIRERETRLRMLLNQAPVLLWTTDTNLRATLMQGSGLKGLGVQSEEVAARLRPVPPDGTEIADPTVQEAHQAALHGGTVTYEIETSNRVFHCHVEPLRNPEGMITGCIGIALDITDRKIAEQNLLTAYNALETLVEERTAELAAANRGLQSEITERAKAREALESSELRYRAIVEEQTELVSRFRLDGTVTFVNEAYCRFFGRDRDDLIGTAFTPLLHQDDVERARKETASITPERRSVMIESRVVRPGNDIRWIQWTVTGLYDQLGAFVEYQSVGRDTTERKNVEILLALQYDATRALAESGTVSEANTRALKAICENLGWDLGILWKVDTTAEMLRFEGIWHVPGVESIMVEHSLLPEVDLPSRVWKKKRPLWIPGNIEEPEQIRPSEGGFRSVLAFPVKTAGNVIAVVECFSRTVMQPTAGILQTLEAIGHQLGNYRDRKIAEESVRKAAEELEARVKQRTEQLAGALEALSNSEMRFRAMFEGAPLGIALLSGTGTVIERNPTLERMLGYPEGGLYGVSMTSLTHPEDVRDYDEHFQSLVNGSQSQYRMEIRYLRRDGSVLWGSLSCSSMHFEGSLSPFIITMIKDVTERKEIEEELRVSENRFRTIFEESPIGIALVDREGRFIQVSPAFAEMVGATPGELFAMNITDLAHAEDGSLDQRQFQDLVEGRRSRYQMEERFHRKDGNLAWGNLNATAIRSGTGEFLYGLRLVEDITLRKETEKRMQMLAHTITSMKESVIITDVDLAIISVNEAFLKTFGYTEKEVLGKHISVLRPPDHPELGAIFEGTLANGWTGELRALRKSGEDFPMILSTSVVRGETGKPIALVGIARDITEQKRLQEKLAEAEKRRLADLRRFAISVQRAQEDERQRISRELHDDICQRLSGMKLNMEVLEDDFKTKDKKTFRTLRGFKKQFEQTITEVRRLSSNLRPTVLDDFGLTIALNLLGREFERAHKIPAKVELGDPTLKHLDPQIEIALYRIAQESLTNIAKHANASHVTLRLGLNGSSVILTVQDDGKGFDPKELPQSKRPGHGLGLISMRERAELLGGTCEIHTAPNEGTTIQVTIPVEVSIDHEEN